MGRLRILAVFCAAWLLAPAAQALPGFAEVRRDYRPSEASLLDRHGVLLQTVRVDMMARRLPWVSLADVSPAMRRALIASEDQRFYQHSGVDWSAVAASAWGNLWHTRTRGASTITMQLAGLLVDDLRRTAQRSLAQKVSQAWVAQSLERHWRKDQILEAYLNLVAFRGELVGVHAMSRVMFGKHPGGLDQSEAAIAVALLRAPNAAPRRVAERACAILKQEQAGALCAGLDGVTELALARAGGGRDLPGTSESPQLAPHLARKLLDQQHSGAALRSTLDATLQRFAVQALRRQLAGLAGRNIEDGALIVIDNASGEVLAWVGSSGSLSAAANVDGVLARRQAGSTLKPFLYELALEQKRLTAASLLDDSPVNLATSAGLYIPQNYDKQFKGLVSLRTALGSSLNIPAVRTLVMVSPERLFQRLQALGFGLRENGDYYGYSLALGSADVTLAALTNAYRALANQGRYSAWHALPVAGAPRMTPVMDGGASFVIGDILSDRSARARTFGLENALSTRIWSAVKTGTSKDMRDNWCVGYSSRYTVGVWVGNASGAPMWDVSGVTGAAPVWQELMHYLHARDDIAARTQKPSAPAALALRQIRFEQDLEAPRREYFLSGTAQSEIRIARVREIRAAIAYPTAGMLVALDPDIPPARQRIGLRAEGAPAGSRWILDGKPLPPTVVQGGWLPWPGRHLLALQDRNGVELDSLRFEVRGAVARPTAAELSRTNPSRPRAGTP